MKDVFFFSDVAGGNIIIPSDPKTREEIKKVIVDISDQWAKIEGYNSIIKEAIEGAAEKFEIPGKYIRKLATAYHKQTFAKEQQEMDDFSALYEGIIGDE